MRSFRQHLREEEDALKIDNPGGQWLKNKQEDAMRNFERHRGLRGAITGYYHNRRLKLPTSFVKDLPGAMGEEHFRNDVRTPKAAALEAEVKPEEFTTKEHPILIGVNHLGTAYIMDGNHRTAYSHRHGIPHVHATIQYYNGAEAVEGTLTPAKVAQIKLP